MSDSDKQIALKASQAIEDILLKVIALDKEISDLNNRLKSIELINRLLLAELRKEKTSSKEQESKSLSPPIKTQEISSEIQIGVVTQKIIWSDGTPFRMGEIEIQSIANPDLKKKSITRHNGTWQRTDLPFGDYQVNVKRNSSGDYCSINQSFNFSFDISPYDLGILTLENKK